MLYAVFDLVQRRVVQRDLPLTVTGAYNFNAVAAGPLRRDGSRYLWAINHEGLHRLRADANEVAYEEQVAAAKPIDISIVTKQLSISADGRKAAWGIEPIYVVDLDPFGDAEAIRTYPYQAGGGMEFSRDGNRLFFVHANYAARASQVAYLDLSAGTQLPPIAITPPADDPIVQPYGLGDLQLGADFRIYIAGSDQGTSQTAYLGVIDGVHAPTPSFHPRALGRFNFGQLSRLPNHLDGERQTACDTAIPCANPVLIRSRVGGGRMELVAPHPGGGLAHYWRAADDPDAPWSGPAIFAGAAGQVDAVALMQGTWQGGNFEVIARTGDQLTHYYYVPEYDLWLGPTAYVASGAAGTPSFIEGTRGVPFDFDLVTPLAAGGIAHYRRDSQTRWRYASTFAADAAVVSDVSLVEGEVEGEELEVVARIGDRLAHYYLDDSGITWRTGDTIAASGVTGPPSLMRGRYPGALEVIAPAAQGMTHFERFYFLWSFPLSSPSPFTFWFAGKPFAQGTVSAASAARNGSALEAAGRVDGCGLAHWRSDRNWMGAGTPIP